MAGTPVGSSGRTPDRGRVLMVNMVATAMTLMQISSINVALPTIETALGARPTDIQWVLSGYALAFGISLVPSGRLGDALGRSAMFVSGLAVFTLASLACGLAPTPEFLNVARVFQGCGAGMLAPQTVGMIQQHFDGRERARAYSMNGVVTAASIATGPVVTGLMIVTIGAGVGWRVPFLLNFALGAAGCVLAWRWLPFKPREGRGSRRADLDPVGATLLTGAVLGVMLPFILGGLPPQRFWLLLAAAVLGAAWLAWEWRYGESGREPMVHVWLLRLPSFTHQAGVSAMEFMGVTSIFVVVAMFLQRGEQWDALHSSFVSLPSAALSCFGAMWAGGHVLLRKQRLVVTALAAVVLGTLASIAVVWLGGFARVSPWWLLVTFGVYGGGHGMFVTSNQTLAMSEVPEPMAGAAGAVKAMGERVATAVGNAVVTAALFSALPHFGWRSAAIAAFAVVVAALLVASLLAVASWVRGGRVTLEP